MAGQNKGGNQEQDLNQILKNRREKLANLQEAGKDPFQITKYDQTHHYKQEKASPSVTTPASPALHPDTTSGSGRPHRAGCCCRGCSG